MYKYEMFPTAGYYFRLRIHEHILRRVFESISSSHKISKNIFDWLISITVEKILASFLLASRLAKMVIHETKIKWTKSGSIREFVVILVIIVNHFSFVSSQKKGTFTGKFMISKANLVTYTPFQKLGMYNNGDTINLADFAS
jgi:6-phosphogluconate dehydrogenase (decarboxylating)